MVFRLHTLQYLLRAQSLDNMLCYLPVTQKGFFLLQKRVPRFYKQRRKSYAFGRFSLSRAWVTGISCLLFVVLKLIKHSNFQRPDYIFLYSQPFQVYSFISIRMILGDTSDRDSNNRYGVNKNCKENCKQNFKHLFIPWENSVYWQFFFFFKKIYF